MWSQVTVSDTPMIDRFCEVARLKQHDPVTTPFVRSEIKRSGFEFYLYEDGPLAISLALGQDPRTNRHIVRFLSYTPTPTSQAAIDDLLDKVREYAMQHGVNTFYAVRSEKQGPDSAQKLQMIASSPGVTLTQSPPAHGLVEIKIVLDVSPVPP